MDRVAVLKPPYGDILILASASPRRRDLLHQIGVDPDRIVPADIDETPRPRELPRCYAARMARSKAETVRSRGENGFILAADTVVALGRRILPKAETEEQARRCLALLSGRRHRVLGAVVLDCPDGHRLERLVTTNVTMKRLSNVETEAYIATSEWKGKAAGYAIQGMAGAFVKSINGSYPNVVGLPLTETQALLVGAGFNLRILNSDRNSDA